MVNDKGSEGDFSASELKRLLDGVPKRILGNDEVFILEDLSGIPYFTFPFTTDYTILTFCLEGSARGFVNSKPIRIVKGDVFVLVRQQMVSYSDATSDIRVVTILISPHCSSQLRTLNPIKMHLSLLKSPILIPKKNGLRFISLCLQMLREALSVHDNPNVLEMVKRILDLLSIHMVDGNHFDNVHGNKKSRMEHFFECFVDELMKHYATSHAVVWYADRLSITPNYLSKCCRNTVGISALEVINRFLTLEAQRQLKVEPAIPLKVIASNLGFSNQSSFCTFFHRITGLSPLKYRNQ